MEIPPNPPPETPETHKRKKNKKKRSHQLVDDASIQIIDEEPGKSSVIVGYLPSGNNLIKPNKSPIFTTYRNHKRSKRVELVAKIQGSKVDYVGTNYSGEAAVGRFGSLRIMKLDKEAGTIEFIPISSGKLFRLEPKVRKLDMSIEEPATPAKSELASEERNQQMGSLTQRYGTALAFKKVKKAEQMRQLENPESKELLQHILEKNDEPKAVIERTISKVNRNVPPHDLSATIPANAYPLDKIILTGESDYINDVLELLQCGEELKPDVYPSFVCNRSHKVVLAEDEEEKRRVAGILSYITHLVNFKNKHSLEGFSSAKHCKFPSMLLQKFTKLFLHTEKQRIADDKIEALLSYVAVLTLHVDEFESDITDIAKDLKMSVLSLRPYFENLGCKFRSRNKVIVATLPVPLQFPTARRKRRGRG